MIRKQIYLTIILTLVCFGKENQDSCNVNSIWMRHGDNLIKLFGEHWLQVYEYNDFPVLLRQGKPVKSPDLVAEGTLVRVPVGIWLSEEAKNRLQTYRQSCLSARQLFDSANTMLVSLRESEIDRHRLAEVESLLDAARNSMTNASFDYKNFGDVHRQAEQAIFLLEKLRKEGRRKTDSDWALPLLLGLVFVVGAFAFYYYKRSSRRLALSEKPLPRRKRFTPAPSLIITINGRRHVFPLMSGVHRTIRVGGADGHIGSEAFSKPVIELTINDDNLTLTNLGRKSILVNREQLLPEAVAQLSLTLGVTIATEGETISVQKQIGPQHPLGLKIAGFHNQIASSTEHQ